MITPTVIDYTVRRGDSDEGFTIQLTGDHSGRNVYFTAKADNGITTKRILDLSTVNGKASVVFDDPNSTLTIPILPAYTEDLQIATLYCDVESVDPLDLDDVQTPAIGTLKILFDIRTEFDGFALPDEAVTFQQLDASTFAVNSLMKVGEVGGVRTMVEYTLAELITDLGL